MVALMQQRAEAYWPQEQERQPPHNIECEQALLGTLLVYNDVFGEIVGVINEAHFFDPLHGRIFELIRKAIEEGKPANPATLRHLVAAEQPIGSVSVADYLYRLETASVPASGAKAYAETIRELASRREIIVSAEKLMADAYATETPIVDAASKTMDKLTNIVVSKDGKKTTEMIGKSASSLIARIRSGEAPESVPTYIKDLDRCLAAGGFKPGQYIIGAGRPGMGKSTIAPQIALNMAMRGNGILYQSLEMSRDDLSARCLSSLLYSSTNPVPYSDISSFSIDDNELHRLDDAAKKLSNIPLLIDDRTGLTVSEITARARVISSQWKRRGTPLRGIIIDHTGKIKPSSRYSGQKVNEVGEVSDALMSIAKELDVFVFALNQLSREVERRDNKRPELADLRNSGDLEQDADMVMFFYREAYYKEIPDDDPEREVTRIQALERCWHKMEVRIAKQRGGALRNTTLFASMPECAVRNYFEPTEAYTQRYIQRLLSRQHAPRPNAVDGAEAR
ncbi:MAG: hypothetical protein C5B44_01420 [Acidobacteria bacterium]|nr:MAG: hypothetical protein C5B44_01420 [Acidobacteriota bacterium]